MSVHFINACPFRPAPFTAMSSRGADRRPLRGLTTLRNRQPQARTGPAPLSTSGVDTAVMALLESAARTAPQCAHLWARLRGSDVRLDAAAHLAIYRAARRSLRPGHRAPTVAGATRNGAAYPSRPASPGSIAAVRLTLLALRDHAVAGWYQHRHDALLAQESRRLRHFFQPGAGNAQSTTAALGLGASLPAAGTGIEAAATCSIGRSREEFSVETGEVGGGIVITTGVGIDAAGGVGEALHINGRIGITRSHARYAFATSPDEWAQVRARHRIGGTPFPRRQGPLACLLRGLGNRLRPGRDHYAHAQSRALIWQERLPLLVGTAAGNVLRPDAPPLLQDIRATTLSIAGGVAVDGVAAVDAGAGAGAGTVGVDAAAGASRLRIHVDLPLDPLTTPLSGHERRSVLHACDRRMGPLITAAAAAMPPASGALAGIIALARMPLADSLDQRHAACVQIAMEFRQAQHLAARIDGGRGAVDRKQSAAVLRSQLRNWFCTDIHQLADRMLDAVHWLALPVTPDEHGCRGAQLRTAAAGTSALLRGYPLPRRGDPLQHRAALYRQLRQNACSVRVSLSGGVSNQLLAAGLAATVTHGVRKDFNPLRAGRSVEVMLQVSAAVDAAPVAALLREAIGETAAGGAARIASWMNDTLALSPLDAQGALQVHLRFFRPDYQDASDFPPEARGMHLQQIRVLHDTAIVIGGRTGTALIPGLGVLGGLRWQRNRARPSRPDAFFADTLSGLLLRYKSVCDQVGEPDAAWQRLCAFHGVCLQRLRAALITPCASAPLEARYWLGQHPDKIDAAALMPASVPPSADEGAVDLRPLFDAMLAAVRHVQSRSDRISMAYFPLRQADGRLRTGPVTAGLEVTRL